MRDLRAYCLPNALGTLMLADLSIAVCWCVLQSIVLPSGMVYHRKYLAMYTEAPTLQPARRLVDDVMNCDDILFNFMVANATNSAPVFIGRRGRTCGLLPLPSSCTLTQGQSI